MKKRRKFDAKFKSEIAIEALREQKPIHEIAKQYQIHPSQVTDWKKNLLANASKVFKKSGTKQGKKKKLTKKEAKKQLKLLLSAPTIRECEIQALEIMGGHADPAGSGMRLLLTCHPDVYEEVRKIVMENLLEVYPKLNDTDKGRFLTLLRLKGEMLISGWDYFFTRFQFQPKVKSLVKWEENPNYRQEDPLV